MAILLSIYTPQGYRAPRWREGGKPTQGGWEETATYQGVQRLELNTDAPDREQAHRADLQAGIQPVAEEAHSQATDKPPVRRGRAQTCLDVKTDHVTARETCQLTWGLLFTGCPSTNGTQEITTLVFSN